MRYLLLFGMFSVISFLEMNASPKPVAAVPSQAPNLVLCRDCAGDVVAFGSTCVYGKSVCEAHPCPSTCDE